MIERSADDTDMASQLQMQANEQALARRQAEENRRIAAFQAALKSGHFDGSSCTACGEDIPAERVAMHQMVCTPCATKKENDDKMKGKR